MRSKLESIVIVAYRRGFVAYVRYADPKLNEDISSDTKWGIYEKVEKRLYRKAKF
jgi:hypothetical protein